MAMQGSLQDMAVADLIQHNCQDYKTARIILDHNGQQASLFFHDGALVHALLDNEQGEEVVYKTLAWQEGQFILEMNVDPPAVSISRSWSGLLLEGARRLDEAQADNELEDKLIYKEESQMAQNLDAILKALGEQVDGFMAASVVGMDGLGVAQHSLSKKMNLDNTNAQMTMFIKLVDTSVGKLGAGVIEDNLLTTEKAYLLIRFLEDKFYFLGIAADRKTAKLGNMRLVSRIYAQRVAEAMPG